MTIKLQNGSVPSAIKIGSTDVLSVRKGSALLWSTTPTHDISFAFVAGSPASGPGTATLPATHRLKIDYKISTFEVNGASTQLKFTAATASDASAFLAAMSTGIIFTHNAVATNNMPPANWSIVNSTEIENTDSTDVGDLLSILGGVASPAVVTITMT